MNRARFHVKDDAGRYVERIAKGGYVAAAWTTYPSAARSFGYTVALAVATRNAAHVVVVKPSNLPT